ncbi:MAG: hypothetical protein IPN08_19180 [Bacteroidales bacterium]|nr:hypothetical protein [Bacteroidales bacterium]MBK9359465.1 hypothetical protein [Bacteroidales bacterium]
MSSTFPEISAQIPVADLIVAYPFSISFLASRNLHCIICGEPVWGTLEELARDKHITGEQLAEIIEDLKTEAGKISR